MTINPQKIPVTLLIPAMIILPLHLLLAPQPAGGDLQSTPVSSETERGNIVERRLQVEQEHARRIEQSDKFYADTAGRLKTETISWVLVGTCITLMVVAWWALGRRNLFRRAAGVTATSNRAANSRRNPPNDLAKAEADEQSAGAVWSVLSLLRSGSRRRSHRRSRSSHSDSHSHSHSRRRSRSHRHRSHRTDSHED